MLKKISLLVFYGSILSPAYAQLKADAGFSFGVGIPQAEFGDNLDNVGFGVQVNGVVGLKGIPIMVGGDLNFMIYGHERRFEPFSHTIPDVTVKVVTDNNIASGHLFLRLQPENVKIRPYADALIGLKYLYTDTKITNDGFEEFEIARSTNFVDSALSYGVGTGIQIMVYERDEDSRSTVDVSIDFGIKYLFGTDASYLKEGSIRRENGRVNFDLTHSKTTLMIPYLGATLSF